MTLEWKPITHPNPKARVSGCEDTLCGLYRVYQQGGSSNWVGIYLPAPAESRSIGVERSLVKAKEWADAHHNELTKTPGTGMHPGDSASAPLSQPAGLLTGLEG